MIIEFLISGTSLISCVGCWAAVKKHRIVAEMQRDKLKHDLEVLKPTPEPIPPPKVSLPSPAQQALTVLLGRREDLESQISDLRKRACENSDARFNQYRADALQALKDAREEHKELVLEETGLLERMQESEGKKRKRVSTTVDEDLAELFDDTEEVDEGHEAAQ